MALDIIGGKDLMIYQKNNMIATTSRLVFVVKTARSVRGTLVSTPYGAIVKFAVMIRRRSEAVSAWRSV